MGVCLNPSAQIVQSMPPYYITTTATGSSTILSKSSSPIMAILLTMIGLNLSAFKYWGSLNAPSQAAYSKLAPMSIVRWCAPQNQARKISSPKTIGAHIGVINWFGASILFLRLRVKATLPLLSSNLPKVKNNNSVPSPTRTLSHHRYRHLATLSNSSFKKLRSTTSFKIWNLRQNTARVRLWCHRPTQATKLWTRCNRRHPVTFQSNRVQRNRATLKAAQQLRLRHPDAAEREEVFRRDPGKNVNKRRI